jgi:hypothetical protein
MWRSVYTAMVSRPPHAMTTAWQLGVQEWDMRDANAPLEAASTNRTSYPAGSSRGRSRTML